MTLKSERFSHEPALAAAAANSPPLKKGCAGKGVAAIQQALIDLDYPMPISTAAGTKPPDGIFGKETDATVRAFQADQKLAVDGDVGRNTMRALDEECVFDDLRPAIKAVKAIGAAIDRVRRDRTSTAAMGRDGVRQAVSHWRRVHLNIVQQIPSRKFARSFDLSLPPPFPDYEEQMRKIREFKILGSGTSIAVRPGLPLVRPGPPLLMLMMAAVALVNAGQQEFPRFFFSWRTVPKPPPPVLPPFYLAVAITLTSITAAALMAEVLRKNAAINKCKERNPGRVSACAAAEKAFVEATSELRKALTVVGRFNGDPHAVARRVNKALTEFDKAFANLTKCLGCGEQ